MVSFVFCVMGVIESIYMEEIKIEINVNAIETGFEISIGKSKNRNDPWTICIIIQTGQFSSSQWTLSWSAWETSKNRVEINAHTRKTAMMERTLDKLIFLIITSSLFSPHDRQMLQLENAESVVLLYATVFPGLTNLITVIILVKSKSKVNRIW